MRRAWALLLLSCVGCGDETVAPGPGVVLADMQAAMKAGRWEIVYDHLPDFVQAEWTFRLIELGAARPPTQAALEDLRRITEPLLGRMGGPQADALLELVNKRAPDRRAFFMALVAWMRQHDMHVHVLDQRKIRRVRLLDWLAEPGGWKVMSLRDSGSHLDGPRKAAVAQVWDGTHMREEEEAFLLF